MLHTHIEHAPSFLFNREIIPEILQAGYCSVPDTLPFLSLNSTEALEDVLSE